MRFAWLLLCGHLAFVLPAVSQSTAPTAAAVDEPTQTAHKLQEFLKSPAYSQTYEEKVLALPKEEKQSSEWLPSILRFLELLQNSQWLVWVAMALKGLLLLLLAWFLWKLYGHRHYLFGFGFGRFAKSNAVSVYKNNNEQPLPSHDKIAHEAHKKLQKGDVVAALSLLYRGSLRAAGMAYALDIGKDKTEMVCQKLLASVSSQATWAYFSKLSEAWIQAAYAAKTPPIAQVSKLVQDFDEAWSASDV